MTNHPFLASKKPFSVNFTYPADTGRVVDGLLCALPYNLKSTNPGFTIASVSSFLSNYEELLSVSFNIEAEKPASVVDGKVLRQSVLYEPNLPRTQALLKVYDSLCSLCALWLNILVFYFNAQQPTKEPPKKSIKKNLIMQNKPNLCVF